ncbi:centromere protein P [Crotalus tigris]|uniref:centromere protein P n=1 Tax=Crotalus tigris TaxID=88082 RepID=UPI00192F217C|nr:centromere protein P [Crotalus tigris]XP_039204165.1 centromere protein P [Crotalus tigris]XP_039204166.1 centromere protein P [Crotalus tigris]XP_039204167.1 centromere protein P [Crotalus tigris]XP_039204169.1 centromere protein P [Crotalus tigris]XP_039204170.1 centromere protein P [Crotalus tigris]XP_039204171.1 centromere protein P [Crotalus tigris]XP_039204172.1 centromere protein P [Crotalus tigris]
MNSDELQAYEDEIKSLEEEIKMLTEEYEHSRHQSMAYTEAEPMEIMKLCRKKPEEELKQSKSSPDQETQLHLLEADLSFIMKFTGIFFTHYSRKLVEKNGSKTIQTYKLSGKCQSISFQLEFKLTKESQMNRNASAIVTDLNVITECDKYRDLSKLVSRVEENGDLCLFFRNFTCFFEWCKHRERTFAYFKNKYPDIVVLPEGLHGDYMLLRSTQLSKFELMIVWKIQVDEKGNIIPFLDILNKIPLQGALADKFASDAPQGFRSLLHVIGIEASIETLINLISED